MIWDIRPNKTTPNLISAAKIRVLTVLVSNQLFGFFFSF